MLKKLSLKLSNNKTHSTEKSYTKITEERHNEISKLTAWLELQTGCHLRNMKHSFSWQYKQKEKYLDEKHYDWRRWLILIEEPTAELSQIQVRFSLMSAKDL
jgi:hypothetical protein